MNSIDFIIIHLHVLAEELLYLLMEQQVSYIPIRNLIAASDYSFYDCRFAAQDLVSSQAGDAEGTLAFEFVFRGVFIDPTPDLSLISHKAKFILHDALAESIKDLLIALEHTLQNIQVLCQL